MARAMPAGSGAVSCAASQLVPTARNVASTGAPRALALARDSSTTAAAPSPISTPRRSRSNGRTASGCEGFTRSSKPNMLFVMVSQPPTIAKSKAPSRRKSSATASAKLEAEQALASVMTGKLVCSLRFSARSKCNWSIVIGVPTVQNSSSVRSSRRPVPTTTTQRASGGSAASCTAACTASQSSSVARSARSMPPGRSSIS
ncbi:hypothetical protein D3C81_602980 [compost metagenome]